ncbi:prf interactor 30137, partial [Genlisea aurea]
SRLSRSNKRKDCSSSSDNNNQRPRPRDRQLIQDRIKELRELVPNSEKCSIDGLLDKTIKHMLFLRNVSDRADKLRKHCCFQEADKMMVEESGASWAVELGSSSSSSDAQTCPIVVKDLDQPGQMLIEMLCCDHGRFLEITNAIHRLQLTVLHGVMEKSPPRESWARFIVE